MDSSGKRILKNVDAIGCKTKAAAEYIKRYSNKETSLTPVGLDESKFSDCAIENDFKKKHGLSDKKQLLYIGKLESRRNPLFLLELMKGMPEDYVLVMVGDGPLFDEVKSRVNNEHMENVMLLSKKKQEELPAIYSASDLFLLASNYEIFGMVILEAMYFGLPVISTSTAGSETLIDKTNGCILKTLDVALWKEAITSFCKDDDRLDKAKIVCKNGVRNHYVWDKAVDKFEELYNTI